MRKRNGKLAGAKRKFLSLAASALVVGTVIPASIQISISLEEQAFLKTQNELLEKYLAQMQGTNSEQENQELKPQSRAASFDASTWWGEWKGVSPSWNMISTLDAIIPPDTLNLSDFLDSSSPYYFADTANWIISNQNNATEANDFIKIYQNGVDVTDTGLKIDHNSNSVEFAFSTPNFWEINQKYEVSITWANSYFSKAAKDYTDTLDANISSEIRMPESEKVKTPYTLVDFITYINSGLGSEEKISISPQTLSDELQMLDINGYPRPSGITILDSENEVNFTLKFPKYTYDSESKLEYWTKDIKITWTNSANKDLADTLWSDALTYIKSTPVEEENWITGAPDVSYQIGDLKKLLNLPSSNERGLSGNYVLLAANDDTISNMTSLDVLDDENKLSLRIAFPINGETTPSISTDINKYNVSDVITLKWKQTRNQSAAQDNWDQAQIKIDAYIKNDSTISGTVPGTIDINYILNELGINQPWNLPEIFTFGYKKEGETEITWFDETANYVIPIDAFNFTFYLRFPELNELNSYFVSKAITFKWENSRQAASVKTWWDNIANIDKETGNSVVDVPGLVPTSIDLSDLTNVSDSSIFKNTWFFTWMNGQPVKDSNPLAKLKLFFNSAEVSELEDIKLSADVDHVIITLQYPETGDWATSKTPLEQDFLLQWTETRNIWAANDYWNSLQAIIANKIFDLPDLPKETYDFDAIKTKLGITDPTYLNTDLNIDKWELWQNNSKVNSISINGNEDNFTFTLKYPKNGVSGPEYFEKTITLYWHKSRDQQNIEDWLSKMPKPSGVIDMGSDSITPESISINDFIANDGLFAHYNFGTKENPSTFYDWYQQKPVAEGENDPFDDLQLYNGIDELIDLVLTIDQAKSDVAIVLKYPDTGYFEANNSLTEFNLSINWGKSINEKMAEDYWGDIKNSIESTSEFTFNSSNPNVGTLKKVGRASNQYTFNDDVKSDFSLPNPPEGSILVNKLEMVNGTIAIDEKTKFITFTLRLPKNGISGSIASDFYQYQISIEWDFTHDEDDIKNWVDNNWNDQYNPSDPTYVAKKDGKSYTYVPDSILVNDLIGFLGTVPNWLSNDEIKVYANDVLLDNTKSFEPEKTKNAFALTFKIAQDGYWDQGEKELLYQKNISYNYDQSNNTHYAQEYYENLSANPGSGPDGIYPGSPPGNIITIDDLKTNNLINNISNNTSLIGQLIFVDKDGIPVEFIDENDSNKSKPGYAVKMEDKDFELEFYLAISKNGVDDKDGYWFNASQKFAFTWAETAIQGAVKTWFESISAIKQSNQPSEKYDIAAIKKMLNLTNEPRPESVDTTISFYTRDPISGEKTLIDPINGFYQVGPDESALNITIGVSSWDANTPPTELVSDLTINWDSSRNDKIVEDWLGTKEQEVNISGYPNTQITYEDVKNLLKGTEFPILEGEDATKNILILLNEEDINSFDTIDINQNTKTLNFYLKYYKNGKEEEITTTTHQVTIKWTQTRQEYLDLLATKVNYESSNSSIGNNFGKDDKDNILNHYTENGAIFGKEGEDAIIKILFETNRNPWGKTYLENLQNDTNLNNDPFQSEINNLKIKINSLTEEFGNITDLDPSNPLSKTFTRSSIFELQLTFLGAIQTVTIKVDYNQADIQNIVDAADNFVNQWDNIEISGNTNEPKIHISKTIIDYFNNLFLTPTLVVENGLKSEEFIIDGINPKWIFNATDNEYILNLGSYGFLKNDNDSNDLTFKLKVDIDPKFTDPTEKIQSLADAVNIEKHFDIWIDTSGFDLWKTDSSIENALVELLNDNTNNWQLNELSNTPNYAIEYRFNYLDESKTDTEWEDLASFNANNFPLWDQFVDGISGKGEYIGNVEIHLKPNRSDSKDLIESDNFSYKGEKDSNYILSDERKEAMPDSMRDSLNKVINFGSASIENGNDSTTNILMQLKEQFSSFFDDPNRVHTAYLDWETNGKKEAINKILADNHLSINYSIDGDVWTSDLPTSLHYLVDSRHFFIKVEAKDGFELNGVSIWDFAKDEKEKIASIDNLLGYIEVPNITNQEISGLTNDPTIKLDELQVGLKYQYWLDNEKGWINNIEDFKKWMNDITLIKDQFKYQIIVSDPAKYILGIKNDTVNVNTITKFNVNNLKTFINIENLETILNSGFTFSGKFGLDGQIELTLKSELDAATLAQSRLKLQYKITQGKHQDWTDLPIPNKGETLVILDNDLIPGVEKPTISFRLVPYLKDGEIPAPGIVPNHDISSGDFTTSSPISEFENFTTTKLSNSDFESQSYIINLPTVVETGKIFSSYFGYKSNESDTHTKNLILDILTSSTQAIQNANSGIAKLDYWDNIVFGFSIDDKNGSDQYAFEANDFAKWLQGYYATNKLPNVWKIKADDGTLKEPLSMEYGYLLKDGKEVAVLPEKNRVPDWNNIDMSSLKVQWVTKTTNNQGEGDDNYNYYIPSNLNVFDISDDFKASVKKWFDVSDIFKAVESTYISGDTHQYEIDFNHKIANPLTENTDKIENSYLEQYGLNRQLSVDGLNWQSDLPVYNNWTEKTNSKLYMSLAQISDDANSFKLDYDLYLAYPKSDEYALFATTTWGNGKDAKTPGSDETKDFKIYVEGNINDLEAANAENSNEVIITGNQYTLDPNGGDDDYLGIDESFDDNQNDYSVLKIEYLYNGSYYDKENLAIAIKNNREKNSDLALLSFPNDFEYNNIKVRWKLTASTDEYVLSSASTTNIQVSNDTDANAQNFKNFVNLWDLQKDEILSYTSANGETFYSDFRLENLYLLSGSFNEATLEIFDPLNIKYLNDHQIKIQYSTVEHPSPLIADPDGDWKDATKNSTTLFENIDEISNLHKSLYIRFVSTNPNATISSTLNGGNGLSTLPIRLDANGMTFTIDVDSSVLKNLQVKGTTQDFEKPTNWDSFFDGTSKGVKYHIQDPDLGIIEIPETNLEARKKWMIDNGLTINFKIKQTRKETITIKKISYKNGIKVEEYVDYEFGDEIIFSSLEDLQNALADKTNKLNFTKDNLWVAWGILPHMQETNLVDETVWVQPNNFDDIINIIFTKDFLTLESDSIAVTGNNLKIQMDIKPEITNNLPDGVELQYSLDGTTKWQNTQFTSIKGDKYLFIRLASKDDSKYLLADDNSEELDIVSQKTELDTDYVQIAINLGDSLAGWQALFNKMKIDGFTAFLPDGAGYQIIDQPTIPKAEDNMEIGLWKYTIDQSEVFNDLTNWYDDLESALPYYKGSKVKSFDHDREDHFTVKYILKSDDKPKNIDGKLMGGYIFTDENGNVINEEELQKDISISNLKQYIYIDYRDPNLPLDPNNDSQHISWKEMANNGKFLPKFDVATGEDHAANFKAMQYKGNHLDANNHSYYKFDVNPYLPKDTPEGEIEYLVRSLDSALAPRHAHFEYNYNNQGWTSDLNDLINLLLESNSNPFQVRIVSDDPEKYVIPETIDWTNDGKADIQTWSRDFPVVIIRDTNSIAAESAQYVGFNDLTNPSGRFLTNDPENKGNPLLTITKLDGESRMEWTDFKSDDSAFVLEYRVLGSDKNPIEWIDQKPDGTKGVPKSGWHEFPEAPSIATPWKGNVPISLKNGDIVQVRLRAKNGYVILDDNSKGLDTSTGFAPYSSEISFPPVSGLLDRLEIPKDFQIYDALYKTDFAGQPVNKIGPNADQMPNITFAGSDGKGTIEITPGSLEKFSQFINFKVQVLRPIAQNENLVNNNMAPFNGYYLLDKDENIIKDKTTNKEIPIMEVTRNGTYINDWQFSWKDYIDDIENTWVDPSSVNYLQVGDAIRIRVEAKSGYAFAWENPDNSYDDIVIEPKNYAQWAYNRGGLLADNINMTSEAVNNTPLPVTGLTITPSVFPNNVSLVYSSEIEWLLEGHAKIKMNYEPKTTEKWKYSFRISETGPDKGYDWSGKYNLIPKEVKNGYYIEVSITNKPGYRLDDAYINNENSKPSIKKVTGLKANINSNYISRPILSFGNYEGSGAIESLTPENLDYKFDSEKIDVNGFASPKNYDPEYDVEKGYVFKWQFQTAYKLDPYKNASESQINSLDWLDKAPTDLKVGDFVRARVAAIDPNSKEQEVIVFPFVYSQPSDLTIKEEDLPDYQKGWVQVSNLKINIQDPKISTSINGFINETSIQSNLQLGDKNNSFDEEAVVIEFRSSDSANNMNTWTSLPNDPKKNGLIDLKNDDLFSMRLRAKEGFIFDQEDAKLYPGMKAFEEAGVWYLEYNSVDNPDNDWTDIKVVNLKKYLNVSGVTITKPVSNPNDSSWLDNFKSMDEKDGEVEKKPLINGFVELNGYEVAGWDSISDRMGNKIDPITKEVYADQVNVHYLVQRTDPNDGTLLDPIEQDDPPSYLSNGDVITVELEVEKNSGYKLSSSRAVKIKVSGLSEVIIDADLPQLKFVGANNEGEIVVQNPAPDKKVYQYAYVKDGESLPSDEEIVWLDRSPSDLANGDMVIVRLVSAISKTQVYQKDSETSELYPVISQWTKVWGLKTKIDLSNFVMNIFNSEDPYEPNKNLIDWQFPFKLEGTQSGKTSIKIAAPLWSDDQHHMLHDQNNHIIEHADKLVWEFAVDDNPNGLEARGWTKALPQDLTSKEYVHVRLAIKEGEDEFMIDPDNLVWTFQLPKLKEEESVDTKTILLASLVAGGAVALGTAGITIYILIKRKKHHFNKKTKM